jgi:hypothetical protein
MPEKKLLAISLNTLPKTTLNFIVYPGIVSGMFPGPSIVPYKNTNAAIVSITAFYII